MIVVRPNLTLQICYRPAVVAPTIQAESLTLHCQAVLTLQENAEASLNGIKQIPGNPVLPIKA